MLDDLPMVIQKRVIKGSLRRGALAIKKGVKSIAPTGRTGVLKRSIKVRSGRGLIAQVFADGGNKSKTNDGWYAHLLERGVQPHSVAKGASVRRGKLQDKGIQHTGFKGRRFMERGAESSMPQAINGFAKRFEELILRELKK